MSLKASCQKSSKGESKLGSYGHELATYFWGCFSEFRHYNHWTKHVVVVMRIVNDEKKQIWRFQQEKTKTDQTLKH